MTLIEQQLFGGAAGGGKKLRMVLPLTPEQAYWHACTGQEYVPVSVPIRVDQYVPARGPFYSINPALWAPVLDGELPSASREIARQEDDGTIVPVSLEGTPALLMDLEPTHRQGAYFGIDRSLWAKYFGQPVTVRSWFRKMRAADFERDVRLWVAYHHHLDTGKLGPWDDGSTLNRFKNFKSDADWTLFDTQQVVDRETAAFDPPPFDPPPFDTIPFVLGITAHIARLKAEPFGKCPHCGELMYGAPHLGCASGNRLPGDPE